jgi:hypothetical protein
MRKASSPRTKLVRSLRRIAMDRKGGVAPLLAVGAVPLLMSVGAAVDFSRASADKAAMQSALDSVALATVRAIAHDTAVPDAQSLFNSLMTKAEVSGIAVTSNTNTASQGTTATLSAQGVVGTDFMRIAGISQLTIRVNSSAFIKRRTDGCVLALSKTASPAVSLGGSTTVGLSDCTVYSNSSGAAAVSVGGSATLTAQMIGAVGGVSASSSNINLTEGIATHLAPIIDPYADMQVPSYSGCTQNNLKVKNNTTIDPGVYCNGISINAGATLTLNPGVYVLDRGSLSINGGGGIVGTGVTLVFTSSTGANYATATIHGNSTVNLTAPGSGSTAGMVVLMDRNAPTGTTLDLSGGSTQAFGGAIYAPTGAVTYTGGASTSASCTQIIGDTVTFTGNSSVAINCSSYKTKTFGANTIRLSS